MSYQSIIDFLNQYLTLTKEEQELVKTHSLVKEYSKGTVLLRQGEVANECYMVLKGCIRAYHVKDGNEETTEIYTENHPFTPASYITREPSKISVVCEEDCVLSLGSMEKTQEMLLKMPRLGEMAHLIGSDLMAKQQLQMIDFKSLSPVERYQKLIETRPELIQRVKQYHLASYLGIKPETLSRIRKKLLNTSGIS